MIIKIVSEKSNNCLLASGLDRGNIHLVFALLPVTLPSLLEKPIGHRQRTRSLTHQSNMYASKERVRVWALVTFTEP